MPSLQSPVDGHIAAERAVVRNLSLFSQFLGWARHAAVIAILERRADAATSQDHGISGTAEWVSIRETTARLRTPSLATSLGQLTSSILPLGALYALMYACLPLGWAAPLALSLVAAGFVVRIFIISMTVGTAPSFALEPRMMQWASSAVWPHSLPTPCGADNTRGTMQTGTISIAVSAGGHLFQLPDHRRVSPSPAQAYPCSPGRAASRCSFCPH